MIQFNLLPDVKKEYIKAKRTKRLIASVCLLVTAATIGATFLLFSVVKFAQTKHIEDLSSDIDSEIAAINAIEDIDKILTIQNQINSLESLHNTKPEFSRMFVYLNQLTPADASVGELDIDLVNGTLTVSGKAESFSVINQFADTLKFARYRIIEVDELGNPIEDEKGELTDVSSDDPRAFSDVITQLSRNEDEATYTIDLAFDPLIFDNTQDVKLLVPNAITTRSILNRPLFDEVNLPEEGQ